MSSNFISVRGIRVHYTRAIPSTGEIQGTFLLIHGFLSNTFTWSKCLQPLADRCQCQVIAYDRFAFGLTERVLNSELYSRNNEELLALNLLEQLKITDCVHLISSSSGAVVAYDLARARPDWIQSIIFVAPYGLLRVEHPSGPISRYLIGTRPVQSILKWGLKQFLPFKNAYYNEAFVRDETVRQGYLKPINDDPLFIPSLVLFTQHYDVSSVPISYEVFHPNQKILIVVGEEDRIVRRRDSEEFYRKFKQVRGEQSPTEFRSIPHCGHLPQEEQSEKLIDLICHFLHKTHSKP